MIVKLLTERYVEFLSLKVGCRGSSKSALVKMPYCWKSHVAAQIIVYQHYQSLGQMTSTYIFQTVITCALCSVMS